MKLVAKVKLLADPAQAAALRETLATANAACNAISTVAYGTSTFGAFDLHRAAYYDVRRRFGLPAQFAVRATGKVADAYKTARTANKNRAKARAKKTKQPATPKPLRQCQFKPMSAFPLDWKLLRWNLTAGTVSVLTLGGRLTVPFAAGPQQRALLAQQRGETDLILHGGTFYLATTCDVAEAPLLTPSDVLGVDLGIVNIATDSDGNIYSGATVDAVRTRHRRLRSQLQKAGTRSATRHLARLAGRERRFASDTNHVIAKRLVTLAEGTGRALALEDLQGIRDRVTVRRQQRARHHSWSFFQLRAFVAYKAQRAGVPVLIVDPRNSSRECSSCGYIDKRNRPTQDRFCCRACGFTALADSNAATNLRARGRAALSTSPSSRPVKNEPRPRAPLYFTSSDKPSPLGDGR